jgi:TPR repeat protein
VRILETGPPKWTIKKKQEITKKQEEEIKKKQEEERRKWTIIRSILKFAKELNLGEIHALAGAIFQSGIGVDVDGRMAYLEYRAAQERGLALGARLVAELETSANPMIRAQILLEKDEIAAARAEFQQCRDVLGMARYGDLLLSSVHEEVVKQGLKLLEAARDAHCAFAGWALGRVHLNRLYYVAPKEMAGELDKAEAEFIHAAEAGHPDAAFLVGCVQAQKRAIIGFTSGSPHNPKGWGKVNPAEWFEKASKEFAYPVLGS